MLCAQRSSGDEEETFLHKCVGFMVHFSLYGFNIVAFLACLIIVAGQVRTNETYQSPACVYS